MDKRVCGALLTCVVCAVALQGFSQAPVITSFSQNGVLVCGNLAPGSVASVEWASSLHGPWKTNWQELQSVTVGQDGTMQVSVPMFYRVRGTNWPDNMSLIPAGSFQMGDSFSEGRSDEQPVHSVYVSAYYMDRYEVSKALWDEVYNWATNHGYSFDYINSGQGKAANHPAHTMTWYDAVKWCNARSEKVNKVPAYYTDTGLSQCYRSGQVAPFVNWNTGYRLPTEAEWEKAARGGVSGRRFPWSDTDNITHGRANYWVTQSGDVNYYPYDVSPTPGYHPTFNDGVAPYTSPVGYFAPNGYGLYDMAGNLWEFCWDWYGSYASGSETDPRGPSTSPIRVCRGGTWDLSANGCRSAFRLNSPPGFGSAAFGFRSVLPPGQ